MLRFALGNARVELRTTVFKKKPDGNGFESRRLDVSIDDHALLAVGKQERFSEFFRRRFPSENFFEITRQIYQTTVDKVRRASTVQGVRHSFDLLVIKAQILPEESEELFFEFRRGAVRGFIFGDLERGPTAIAEVFNTESDHGVVVTVTRKGSDATQSDLYDIIGSLCVE